MRVGSVIASSTRHVLGVGFQAILIAAIIAGVALAMSEFSSQAAFIAGISPADAAGRPSAAIAVPDGVFGGTTTATANPGGESWVHIRCYTAGSVGLEAWKKVDANDQATFQLGPTPSWASGGATCEATEGN